MTKNVTLRLDETVLKQARHKAVEADQSLSRWLADLITRNVTRSDGYEKAKRRALKYMKEGLPMQSDGKPFSRESLHERRQGFG